MSLLDARLNARAKERRANPRFPVSVPALFRTISNVRCGRLSNISIDGAKMEFAKDEPPPAGISGMLTFAGEEKFCRIVWQDTRACGVKFERPLVQAHLTRIASERFPDERRIARTTQIPLGRKRGQLVTKD